MKLRVTEGQGFSIPLVASRVILVLAAAALAAAFFLPWGSADAEYREAVAQMPDMWFSREAGLTVADAEDLSLAEYARAYAAAKDMGVGEAYVIYAYAIYAGLALAALAAVLAVCGRPIGSAVSGVLAAAVLALLRWDFADRGVLPNDTHAWGWAVNMFMAAAVALVAASIAMAFLKHCVKKDADARKLQRR